MNKFVKRTIAGAIVGGTIVSFGVATSNLINDGKFELIRDKDSKIMNHQYIRTITTPEKSEKHIEYISRYNPNSKVHRDSSFVFSRPCGFDSNGIKVEKEAYYLKNISDNEVSSLLKNVDLNSKEDLQSIKDILEKMNTFKPETSYGYISTYGYQNDYLDKNISNKLTYYSYEQNYDKTKLQPIDSKELEIYNSELKFKIALGCAAGAFVFGGYYNLKQNKKKKMKRKVR